MNDKNLISIIVPIYNVEKYLKRCIDSIINQTYKKLEIILVDDGSKDNSGKICDKYAKKDIRIKVIHKKNEGVSEARNVGLKVSTGEYIGFVDADDFVEKDMYEKMYKKAKEVDADIVICDYQFYPNNKIKKKKWYNPYKGEITGEFLNRNTQPWNKIVSNKLIKETNFKFFEKNGDGVFIYLILSAGKIVSIEDILYNYRVGHSSMSTNYNMNNFEISVKSCEKQIELLKETKYKKELKEYFEYRKIYVLIQAIAVSAKTKQKDKFNKYANELKRINYKKNKYNRTILKKEFNIIKYLGMIYILPINYRISSSIIGLII